MLEKNVRKINKVITGILTENHKKKIPYYISLLNIIPNNTITIVRINKVSCMKAKPEDD